MSWRGKEKSSPGKTFQAPPGFRDSETPAVNLGEVIASAYSIRTPIARGDNGMIFEAWDMLVERTVALKIAWRDPGVQPLLLEARRCAAISDPAAVAIHAIGNHRGVEYVVAERTTGHMASEVIGAYAASGAVMPPDDVIDVLHRAARGVAAAHAVGVTLGEVSAETIAVGAVGAVPGERRVILGSLSMAQIPSVGAAQTCWAPEIITRDRSLAEPAARVAVDLYGLGCLAVELATSRPPYVGDSVKATLFGHVHHRPPPLAELRADLPVELGDLVGELLDKRPDARPAAAAVASQLQAISERAAATRRIVRALIVDDDGDRVRTMWSVLRRAHARATVDAARDGQEAVAKLRRDHPDLVVIDTRLAGSMNALELCMYVSGLEETRGALVVAIADDVDSADSTVLTRMGAHHLIARDHALPAALAELVQQIAAAPRFSGSHGRITISG